MEAFLAICSQEKGTIAIHCKSGLARTGTLIAVWLILFRVPSCPTFPPCIMATLNPRVNRPVWQNFLACEAIAWVRLVRPGSIIGPQHAFLLKVPPYLDMGLRRDRARGFLPCLCCYFRWRSSRPALRQPPQSPLPSSAGRVRRHLPRPGRRLADTGRRPCPSTPAEARGGRCSAIPRREAAPRAERGLACTRR